MSNRRVITYSLIGVLLLLLIIIFLVINLFSKEEELNYWAETTGEELALYGAVPSDAVMVLHLKNSAPLFGEKSPLRGVESQVVVSLHYPAKNRVAPLYVLEANSKGGDLFNILKGTLSPLKRYNATDIYCKGDSLYFANYKGLLIVSPSVFVIENSIRHLQNATSILDNTEFKELAEQSGKNALFINHSQIGKFFSGVTESNILKYSDFFLDFASWSCLNISQKEIEGGGVVKLFGKSLNGANERYFSSLLAEQKPVQSLASTILPANTAFMVALPLYSQESYLDGIERYKAVHKDLNDYNYIQVLTRIEGEVSPATFIDSLKIEEIVSAYCSFGGEYEWITLIREREISQFSPLRPNKEGEVEVKPYKYKNYISSLFGNLFANVKEDSFCRIDNWIIIGPELFVKAFARGAAKQFTLEDYLSQSPAKEVTSGSKNCFVLANLKLLNGEFKKIVKPEYAALCNSFESQFNFAYLSVSLTGAVESLGAEIEIYGANLEELPQREVLEEAPVIVADSTIKVENGSFELKDFTTGGKCYLEQLKNYNLRYLNGQKKALWTIPFSEPLCGSVVQIDFFNNQKLQMLFATKDKLYLLDRLGRIVGGFPVALKKSVVLGPTLVRQYDGDYTIALLDSDNNIALYKVTRNSLESPVEIKSGEFVSQLPTLLSVAGEDYLVVKTVSQTKIFTMQGFEITGKEKRSRIAKDSEIKILEESKVEYTGIDNKLYIMDLNTGKSQKAK